jgi:SNF2 family DNA or RNA helicase
MEFTGLGHIEKTCGWPTEGGPCALALDHEGVHDPAAHPPVGHQGLKGEAIGATPQEASQSPLDDPEIKALQADLVQLMRTMDAAAAQMAEAKTELVEVRQEKQEYVREINKKISSFDARIGSLDGVTRNIERQLQEAERQKKRLLADIDHKLEANQALELLRKARERWQQVIDENEWLWITAAREYQRVGIEFIASAIDRDLGGIALLDQMGLGKTLQARGAVDLMQHHPNFVDMCRNRLTATIEGNETWLRSVLWVTPDSIKSTTAKELSKWTDAPVVVLEGDAGMRDQVVRIAHQTGMTLVVGYAQLRDRKGTPVTPALFEFEWPIMVADEIQEARNETSATFARVRDLVRRSGMFIPMSGTPIENKAIEFWVILHLLTQKGKRQDEFYRSLDFYNTYLYSTNETFMHGAFQRLMASVSDMVLRRTKEEVLTDLPDKQRSVRFVQMVGEQRDLYDKMRDQLYIWLDQQKGEAVSATNFLAQLTYLRQIALYPGGVRIKHEDGTETFLDCDESAKLDDAMGLIRTMMESNEKVLVFANFNKPLYRLQELIEKIERLTWIDSQGRERQVRTAAITGDTKQQDRSPIIDRFNDPDDDLRVVVGNIKAMGLGMNLQESCSQCIFLDLYWNPTRNEQAEDRLHRQGQKNNVTIHIIQAENAVDAFIADIIERKMTVQSAMLDRAELRRALDSGMI